jgi:hypothetical protein
MSAPMSTDLIVPGEDDVQLLNVDSGEMVNASDADAETLAVVLREIQTRLLDLSQKKRWIGGLMVARMDAGATWTARAAGVKVTAKSPQADTVEWDVVALDAILDELVAEKVITAEAKTAAVSQRIELVKHAAGIKALEKLPAVAERIATAKSTVPASERHVSVSVIS